MQKKATLVMAGLTTIVVTAETGSANAADAKVYSAYDCKTSVEAPRDANGLGAVVYTMGTARNNTNRDIVFSCSITRDHGPIERGWVRIVDVNPTSDFECSIHVYNRFNGENDLGSSIQIDMSAPPGWPPPGIDETWSRSVNFGAIPNTEDESRDVYFLDCRVPAKYNGHLSGIVSYRVEETSPD